MVKESAGIKNEKKLIIIALFITAIMFCVSEAYKASAYADFIAVNGYFQNYNVVRRYMSGQIPYVDFIPYLGMGHMFLGSVFTALLGGSYGTSLFAFDFLSLLIVFLFVVFLSVPVIKERFGERSVYYAFLVYEIYILISNLLNITGITDFTYHVGNSARIIRGGALLVFIMIELFLFYISEKWIQEEKKKNRLLFTGTSIAAGIVMPYGNDYGIATFICALIFTLFIAVIKFKSIRMFIMSLISFICIGGSSVFVTVSVFTKGHFLEWFYQNFILHSYQQWYFNPPEDKTFYLYSIDLSIFSILSLVLTVYYMCMYARRREDCCAIKRYGLPAFANMTCFAATNEYKLLGGGDSGIYEILAVVVIVSIIVEIIHLLSKYAKKIESASRYLQIISLGFLIVLFSFSAANSILLHSSVTEDKFFAPLGGYFDKQYYDLVRTYEFIGEKTVFSEYASAVEAATYQFQPSGTDYIIHCLNDGSREQYLNAFRQGDYDYVTTIKEPYSVYGYWIRNANWFFMREVYNDYHVVGENNYEYFWEKTTDKTTGETESVYERDIVLNVKRIDSQHTEITVEIPVDKNGIADVYVDYSSNKTGGLKSLVNHNSLIGVRGYYHKGFINSWGLRPCSKEFIPVEIHNGKGSVVLYSLPSDCTELTVNEASCSKIFIV